MKILNKSVAVYIISKNKINAGVHKLNLNMDIGQANGLLEC